MFMRLMAGLVGLVLVTGPASATLIGLSIDAELIAPTFRSEVVTQFSSPSLIMDPGVEFSGVLGFDPGSQNQRLGEINLDFDDTGLNIFVQLINFGGSICCSRNFFHVRIFNFSSSIVGLTGEGDFTGVPIEINFENNGTIIDIEFQGWSDRLGGRLAFVLLPEPPTNIPEPSALTLFATGLAGLGFMMRRRRRSMQLQAA